MLYPKAFIYLPQKKNKKKMRFILVLWVAAFYLRGHDTRIIKILIFYSRENHVKNNDTEINLSTHQGHFNA